MSVDNVRPEVNPLFAFTLTIVSAFAAGLPMAVAIIWICSKSTWRSPGGLFRNCPYDAGSVGMNGRGRRPLAKRRQTGRLGTNAAQCRSIRGRAPRVLSRAKRRR